jgi:putative transposase
MTWHGGHLVSQATVLRIMLRRDLLQPIDYQRERRALATERKAAFLVPPVAPNQVWQLDLSEFETTSGGTWRLVGVADYWSKYEFGWNITPTANQHDAIAAVEVAIAEAEALAGRALLEAITDQGTGEIRPIIVVTDDGGPFRSDRFARFVDSKPELAHVRTRVRTPGQNGVRERAFGSLKYERTYHEEIGDGLALAEHAETYRTEFNTIRPHEALSWNRPKEVHHGNAKPLIPNFPEPENVPATSRGTLPFQLCKRLGVLGLQTAVLVAPPVVGLLGHSRHETHRPRRPCPRPATDLRPPACAQPAPGYASSSSS